MRGLIALGVLGAVLAAALPGEVFQPLYAHASLIFPALPVAASVRAWHRRRGQKADAWKWIVLGVLGFYMYELFWYRAWWVASEAGSTVAEFINLAFAPLVLVGLLRGAPRSLGTTEQRRRLLDALILTLASAGFVHAAVVLSGGSLRPVTGWRDLFLLASPLADLVTLAGLALLWVRREEGPLPSWASAVGLSLLIGLVADAWHATPASVGSPSPWFVCGSWFGSWAAIGVGAIRAVRPPAEQHEPSRISRLPYVIALGCYGALGIAVALNHREAIVSATVSVGVLTMLVLARQLVSLRDITRLQEERARHQADARLAGLVRYGGDMLAILTPDSTVTYASPSHHAVLGFHGERFVGRRLLDWVHPDDVADAERALRSLLAHPSQREAFLVRLRDASGAWRWIEAVATNLLDEPSIGGLVVNSRDISDRKELEVQLLEQALRDPLTGLGNRRLFGDRLTHALSRRHRRPESVAVLLLDLDHFKVVNDSLGHAKGDALLLAVADRLRVVLRTADTVARLGGDEFAILLEDLENPHEADVTATRVQQALSRPFLLDEREVTIRASIGIAWATEDQDGDDLLTDADVAMYGAKNSGRGCVERFSTAMRASVAERLEVEADLRRALDRHEFEVVYQPVVDLVTGKVSGAEALLRWHHPTKGTIPPTRFIPVAEDSDLILELGRFVLHRAVRDAARFRGVRPESARMRVAVNLSARQLLSPQILADIDNALGEAQVPYAALAVELTESVLASNEDVIAAHLHALRERNVRIALDDFGTGYSALAYLRKYPIDLLKVDKSFVSWVRDDVGKDGVTRAIIAMGHSLSLRTIAEGIETRDQLVWLQSLGCALGQGYLFSLPVDADAFAALLHTWRPSAYAAQIKSSAYQPA